LDAGARLASAPDDNLVIPSFHPQLRAGGLAVASAVPLIGLTVTPAAAHLVTTGLGAFYDGMAHPFTSVPDLLMIAALGWLAGTSSAASARSVAFVLPLSCLAAGLVVAVVPALQLGHWVSFAALVMLGAFLATGRAGSTLLLSIAALIVGSVIGSTNEAIAAGAATAIRYLLGAALALFVFTIFASALALLARRDWMRIGTRIAGSWIATIGLLMMGLALKAP
jgi:urease accessory protein